MINEEISEGDGMFLGDRNHYFAVGQSALRCIEVSKFAAAITTFDNILDFPCGHGRVLRHLQSAFPAARLTACDIDPAGVDFCAATFGATPVYGHTSPNEIKLQGNYDLIWVGSLLTHLDADGCVAFLELFRANLRRKGLLVFTIHGRAVAHRLRTQLSDYGIASAMIPGILDRYSKQGFGYASYPVSTPGVGENYGISLASPCWVYNQLEKMPDLRWLNYIETGWDNHQDVVTFLQI